MFDRPFAQCADGASFWLTNVPFATLQKLGLLRRPDLRDDAFLLTRPDGLIAELGLRDAPLVDRVTAIAQQLQQCLDKALEWFGLPSPPDGYSLALALRKHLFRFPESVVHPEISYAFASASQEVTFSGRTDDLSATAIRRAVLRHHRQDYAIRMLDVQVPTGEWSEVFPPADPQQVPRWVKDTVEARPLLLRASVQFRGEHAHRMAMLTGLGAGAQSLRTSNGRQSNLRAWLAAPEYLVLCPHADVTIHGALAAERYHPNPYRGITPITTGRLGHEPVFCGPLQMNGASRMAYSVGLLCEALWMALVKSGGQKDATAMWIGAHDRAECLRTALAIMDLGYPIHVTGFSRGRIWLAISEDGRSGEEIDAMLATVAACCRLVPPVMPAAVKSTARLQVADEMAKRACREKPRDPALAMGAVAVLGNRSLVNDILRVH
ncbi:MAG: hypothetical protein ABIW82_17045 [Dokdonella sp.]